jgi:SWI/SNF-related matrix-associated actin-dependent regulator 1 of chromatin subfamily A
MEIDELLFGPAKPDTSGWSIPALAIDLLPHQEEAVKFALEKQQTYLALDMGLGKTACAIAVIASAHQASATPAIIIVPPSLRRTWLEEFKKFAPHLKVRELRGQASKPLEPADVYIIGDSIISCWVDDLAEDPNTLLGKFRVIVVDEAHRSKNMSASRTRAIIKLANTCDTIRILMSGTPTPNGRNQEMGPQIESLGSSAWDGIGGKGKFWSYHCPVERDPNGKLNKFGKRANIDSLGLNEAMTSSFMLRRKRGDVLDLPTKGRGAVHIEGLGKAVSDYKLAEDDLIAYLAGEGKEWRAAVRNEALVKLTTMRKLAGECKVKGVIERAKEFLRETKDYDVVPGLLIIAEHHSVMGPLVAGLEKYGVVAYNGTMNDDEKAEAVKDFNSGKARVFVGQIKSAGVGLTLHGDGRNHHVIICQLPWSPADIQQAEDRVHRIGQTSDVNVEICLASIDNVWTIDERLWALLETKAFSAGEIIDGKGEFLLEEIQDNLIDSYR